MSNFGKRAETGYYAEVFAEGYLGFHGYDVYRAHRNNPGSDLFIKNGPTFQVKGDRSVGSWSAEVKNNDAFDFLVIVVLREDFGPAPRIWIIPKRETLATETSNGTRTITVADLRGPLAKYENISALKSFPPDPNVEAPNLESYL